MWRPVSTEYATAAELSASRLEGDALSALIDEVSSRGSTPGSVPSTPAGSVSSTPLSFVHPGEASSIGTADGDEATHRQQIDELNARGAALLGPVDGPRLARGREPPELPAGGFPGLPRFTTDESEELDMQVALRASATLSAAAGGGDLPPRRSTLAEEAALRWA